MEAAITTRFVDWRAERDRVRGPRARRLRRSACSRPRYDVGAGTIAYYLSENIPTLSTFTDTQFSETHHCDFWEPIL
jgi:hypothetical protein